MQDLEEEQEVLKEPTAERLEEPMVEQPEEPTVEEPVREQLEKQQQQEILHQHRIHHHLIVADEEAVVCLNVRGVSRCGSLLNPLKLWNKKNSMEMPEKTLIPGGY
jgi:hypothetical protein